ncbi:methylated-DNA-protein-cysteine methyltransferase-like protein [Bacillus tianshenii]|uniref:Methylated-DNA-protein-cysteine methyltransferase-like protein n=1 Tax=Sutcliffiella tianshenii TaxID=1463404 RepID=A0ABS2P1S1_9BACI|nr:MGMT family protein [Bacillus tianshenii]MBM7620582.1 methylated-DNA-protein-cysteine methyltransferase-like protein [Bacillus tianshenii]MCA1319862.1 MGMT family protein [Bacillus tianshenii]
MNLFTERAIMIMKQIPAGKVMSYGQIAALAGSPRGARQVVRILHSMSRKYDIPWHRVINAKGEIGFKDEQQLTEQKSRLEKEHIMVDENNRIDLKKYRYMPEELFS